jgi:hypothetical protein
MEENVEYIRQLDKLKIINGGRTENTMAKLKGRKDKQ